MSDSESPLSIVICAYNALEYTRLLVESIRKYSSFRHEVVLYSDGSTDGTLGWLREQEDLTWQHDRKNRGICTAINRAAQMATRPYLFFPNTDHVLPPGWDRALLPRLAPRKVVSTQSIEPGVVPVAPIFHRRNYGSRWDEFDEPAFHKAAKELSKVEEVAGINYPFALPRSLWDELGGLDPRFDPGPGNDPDFFYRLHLAGTALVRAQDVVIYHFSGKSSRMAEEASAERKDWHELTERNERRFKEKWGERYRYSNGGLPAPGKEALRRWNEMVSRGKEVKATSPERITFDRPSMGSGIPEFGTTARGIVPEIQVEVPLRVLIDGRSVSRERQGIGVYTANLVHALTRLKTPPEIHCLTSEPELWDLEGHRAPGLIILRSTLSAADPREEQEGFLELLRRTPAHIFHGPAFSLPSDLTIPSVVTIHDLAFLLYPQWYPKEFVWHLGQIVERSLRGATDIIAVSEQTKRDLTNRYSVSPDKIHAIHEALPREFKPGLGHRTAQEAKEQFTGGKDFILSVGTKQGRKGALTLVQAFAKLKFERDTPLRLLLVGGESCEDPRLKSEIAALDLLGEVILTGQLSDDDLAALYASSSLFVYPSLYEGFGLPLLEAMASGVPVVSSSGGSLPEVAGDAAAFFPPGDAPALERVMGDLLRDRDLREDLVRRGKARLSQFSWEKAAKETLGIYRKAAAGKMTLLGSVRGMDAPEAKPLSRPWPDPSQVKRSRPRIAIDARLVGNERTGTGRYTSEILTTLPRVAKGAEFVLIAPGNLDFRAWPSEVPVLQHVEAGVETLLDSAWEQFSLPSHLLGCDFYFSPTGIVPLARPCKAMPVIHDLGFLDYPEYYEPALRVHLERWMKRSCEMSESLIAVSEFTKERIRYHYGVPPGRIRVVHHGPSGGATREIRGSPCKASDEGYVLCISSFEPNKNLALLIAAFSEIAAHWRGRLVLAGRRGRALGATQDEVKKRKLGDRVFLKVDPSDQEIADLYRNAALFAYPSLYEGFGLPLLEAMASGLPVIALKRSACPEVVGAGGVLLDDPDPGSFARAIKKVLADEAERGRLREAALKRAGEFSWEKAARETWLALVTCLGGE